jgi:hypothetical protein
MAAFILLARQELASIEIGQAIFKVRDKKQTLTPGMKVKTVIHPLRDGKQRRAMAITLPDGTVMGNPKARPSANAGGGPANQ